MLLPFSSPRLDEATSALDSNAESQVNQAISTILAARNITVVLVAHRLSSIAQAETVVVLEAGRVTEQGLYSELVRLPLPFLALSHLLTKEYLAVLCAVNERELAVQAPHGRTACLGTQVPNTVKTGRRTITGASRSGSHRRGREDEAGGVGRRDREE